MNRDQPARSDGQIPRRQFSPNTVMTTHRIVRIVAGFFVLLSLSLGVEASPLFHSSYWLWFTAFVGANLFQSGFTQFCPLELVLKKLGVRETCN